MLTVPTWDLVGVIADVLPFTHPKPEVPSHHGVRLEWDGEVLHAVGTDALRVGWSQWSPADKPTDWDKVAEDDLFTEWGEDGAGPPRWGVFLRGEDARQMVRMFRLPAKQGRVPLTVEVDLGRIVFARSAATGHSAITAEFEGMDTTWTDPREELRQAATLRRVDQLAFSAKGLADFAKVRQVAPMELRFTGPTSLTHVAIGKRFAGAIRPTKLDPAAGGES